MTDQTPTSRSLSFEGRPIDLDELFLHPEKADVGIKFYYDIPLDAWLAPVRGAEKNKSGFVLFIEGGHLDKVPELVREDAPYELWTSAGGNVLESPFAYAVNNGQVGLVPDNILAKIPNAIWLTQVSKQKTLLGNALGSDEFEKIFRPDYFVQRPDDMAALWNSLAAKQKNKYSADYGAAKERLDVLVIGSRSASGTFQDLVGDSAPSPEQKIEPAQTQTPNVDAEDPTKAIEELRRRLTRAQAELAEKRVELEDIQARLGNGADIAKIREQIISLEENNKDLEKRLGKKGDEAKSLSEQLTAAQGQLAQKVDPPAPATGGHIKSHLRTAGIAAAFGAAAVLVGAGYLASRFGYFDRQIINLFPKDGVVTAAGEPIKLPILSNTRAGAIYTALSHAALLFKTPSLAEVSGMPGVISQAEQKLKEAGIDFTSKGTGPVSEQSLFYLLPDPNKAGPYSIVGLFLKYAGPQNPKVTVGICYPTSLNYLVSKAQDISTCMTGQTDDALKMAEATIPLAADVLGDEKQIVPNLILGIALANFQIEKEKTDLKPRGDLIKPLAGSAEDINRVNQILDHASFWLSANQLGRLGQGDAAQALNPQITSSKNALSQMNINTNADDRLGQVEYILPFSGPIAPYTTLGYSIRGLQGDMNRLNVSVCVNKVAFSPTIGLAQTIDQCLLGGISSQFEIVSAILDVKDFLSESANKRNVILTLSKIAYEVARQSGASQTPLAARPLATPPANTPSGSQP